MKIYKYIILFLFFIVSIPVIAQYEYPGEEEESEKGKKKKQGWYQETKFFFGGNLGLSFGTYTYIEIAPFVGYKITPRLWAGLGPKYMYMKYSNYYETSIYGLKTFALFSVIKNLNETVNIGIGDIFAYVENETLNVEPTIGIDINGNYIMGERQWLNITLIGGGLRFPLGARAGFSIIVLWDVSQNPYYSYSNPELRITVDF